VSKSFLRSTLVVARSRSRSSRSLARSSYHILESRRVQRG
jgi:hypothetical protein